ncbi:MAG TPA: dihydroneopterin aldolase [Chitinophagales bacterium]|jgi:dihydroneopterin aldolase|nr:dihydroneopterin aldolase [Chitinophagales bacterium]
MQDRQKKVWIGLEGMEFYAYHGVYEEERKIGGKYIVDVLVYTNAKYAELHDDLNGTVNYEQIYKVVEQNMQQPVKLIERLARKIMDDIRLFVVKEDTIRIKIRKLNPPLGAKVKASVVEMED